MSYEKEGIEALKSLQSEYLKTVWQTFGALIIAIGWLLSFKETRAFFGETPGVRYTAIAVTLLMALMHWLTLNDLFRRSDKINKSLTTEDTLYNAIRSSYEIKKIHVFASFLINCLLYALLIVSIVFAQVDKDGKNQEQMAYLSRSYCSVC